MAEDAAGNSVALVYFGGNSGWVKKLLPIGETKIVSIHSGKSGERSTACAASAPSRREVIPSDSG
jgi:hypothetical protein